MNLKGQKAFPTRSTAGGDKESQKLKQDLIERTQSVSFSLFTFKLCLFI